MNFHSAIGLTLGPPASWPPTPVICTAVSSTRKDRNPVGTEWVNYVSLVRKLV